MGVSFCSASSSADPWTTSTAARRRDPSCAIGAAHLLATARSTVGIELEHER
ncbi:hypothetical protein FrEUN1fDRAFT_2860 [Parafrankia sp. EUN1f]|nr:hypothetical protein FrEUN1fDRAFT_2860 [Parafrankia sp. EUN1f]